MFRVEMIIDQSIEDILLEALDERFMIKAYSHFTAVKGTGVSGPKRGDDVWPEENSVIVVYAEKDVLPKLKELIGEIRANHPNNGLAVFACRDAEEL